jgi:farnesyl-diphosphate farnesyltransferase
VRESFLHHQGDAAERRLMERFSDGLSWLATMREVPLRAIREVLQHIIEGQRLDLERFPGDGRLRCLVDDAELDDYTWRVAGCVGEFWTGLCATEKPGALDPAVPVEQMKLWGADFGRGLQLVNILRDIGEDLRDGRGYLPDTVVAGRLDAVALQAAWRHWAAACRLHLEAGLHYVRHVADAKLRYATALPLLLAARTLALLRAASWQDLQSGVKVSRLEVARLLAEAALACRHPDSLERLFRRLAGEA